MNPSLDRTKSSPGFQVFEPKAREIPVVVEVPHAGLQLDPLALPFLAAPAQSIGEDADLYVDQLYAAAPLCGATLLVATPSRYIIDLNRAPDDYDSTAVKEAKSGHRPHGLIWNRTTRGTPAVYAPIPQSELKRRLQTWYFPYHNFLNALLEEKKAKFGHVILLCAHSMPSQGKRLSSSTLIARADVVPGSRSGTSCNSSVLAAIEQLAQVHGCTVEHDTPYQGGYSTQCYGKPNDGYHAVQIELSRRLYMQESTLQPRPEAFTFTQKLCKAFVTRLGAL